MGSYYFYPLCSQRVMGLAQLLAPVVDWDDLSLQSALMLNRQILTMNVKASHEDTPQAPMHCSRDDVHVD